MSSLLAVDMYVVTDFLTGGGGAFLIGGGVTVDPTRRALAAVVVAAGTAYGKHGEGYVRISLTVPDKRLEEAMERIKVNFKK